jgi:hypothetical protein
MESGENPELSRSGIQIRFSNQPIARKSGEGGEKAKLGARILALPSLVICALGLTRQTDPWSSAKGGRREKNAGDASSAVLSS